MNGNLGIIAGTGAIGAVVRALAQRKGMPHVGYAIAPLWRRTGAAGLRELDPFDYAAILREFGRDGVGKTYFCGNFPVSRLLQAAILGQFARQPRWLGDRMFAERFAETDRRHSYAIRYLESLSLLLGGQGIRLLCAREVFPELTVRPGTHTVGNPGSEVLARLPDLIVELDRRAAELPEQRLRLSQAAIVADGQLVAIEHSSTDSLLRRAGDAGRGLRDRCLLKMPSVGFYPALDQPAIGPRTAEGAVKAGLSGLIVCAELTIIIDRERTIELLDRAGLFLYAVPLAAVCDVYRRRLGCAWADAVA